MNATTPEIFALDGTEAQPCHGRPEGSCPMTALPSMQYCCEHSMPEQIRDALQRLVDGRRRDAENLAVLDAHLTDREDVIEALKKEIAERERVRPFHLIFDLVLKLAGIAFLFAVAVAIIRDIGGR